MKNFKTKFLLVFCVLVLGISLAVGVAGCMGLGNDDNNLSHTHAYGDWEIITDPTCVTAGEIERVCLCGNTQTEIIEPLNHDLQEHEAKNSTCTEIGWNAYQTCLRCDYTTYKEIPALGHYLLDYAAKDATCTEIGWNAYQACLRCDYNTFKAVPMIDHEFQDHAAKDATCTEIGWNAYRTCLHCDYSDKEELHALMSHDYKNGFCIRCNEQEPTLNNLSFILKNDSYYEVNKFNEAINEAIIPSLYNGKSVVIGENAFYNCTSLINVVIPNGVTFIGDNAFNNCLSLRSISIPDSVTSIGKAAFKNCSSLETVNLGENIIFIKSDAFYGCPALTIYCETESAPSGWSGFWNYSKCPVVWNCNKNDTADDGNIYVVENGIRYALKDGKATVVRQPKNLTDVIISDNISYKGTDYPVVYIVDDAFQDSRISLRSITFGKYITTIGKNSFYDYSSLASVVLGENISSICDSAFSLCTSLASINLPESLTTIGSNAFAACPSLTTVLIPDNVKYIGQDTFDGCNSLTIYCETESAPSGWSGFWNYWKCPVVWNCNKNDTADDGNIYVVENGIRYALKDGKATVVRQPKNLTDVIISDNINYKDKDYPVISIGDDAFNDSDHYVYFGRIKLSSIIIPNGIVSIGSSAFHNCSSLKEIFLPDSVTTIGSGAFSKCSSISNINMPNSVLSIGKGAFDNCFSLKYNEYSNSLYLGNATNPYFALIKAKSEDIKENVIYNTTKIIADYAFGSCSLLKQMIIPDSVTAIGSGAFSECSSLSSIIIPNSVTEINHSTFYNCSSLSSVTISDRTAAIGVCAFEGCSSLGRIDIPNSVTKIGAGAFRNCSKLTTINIPYGVTVLGDRIFDNCSSLSSIIIPYTVTEIGTAAFNNCSSLKSINIPYCVNKIGYYAFNKCYSLKIHCEVANKPYGWDKEWCDSHCMVVWGNNK